MQVDAIKQRTGHLGLIIGGATRRAGAGKPRISQMSTFAGVHRSDKLHTRRKSHMSVGTRHADLAPFRSEEHTSELQSLMRISYAVFCLKKKKNTTTTNQ